MDLRPTTPPIAPMQSSIMSFKIARNAASIGLILSMSCSTNRTPPRIVSTLTTKIPISDRVIAAHTLTSI